CPPVATDVPLRPAMTLTSRLALVKEVGEGHSIGYGRIRSTDRRTRLGLVPIGYADGLHRTGSDQVDVVVRTESGDHRAPQVGRISMDQIVVDLGPDSDARAGDRECLISDAGSGQHSPACATTETLDRTGSTELPVA